MTGWYEHRIVAEASVAARRPHKRSEHFAFKAFDLAIVGPGDGQCTGEMGIVTRLVSGGLHFAPHPFHGSAEVAIAFLILGPTCREDSRQSVKRVDGDAAVV